eukprot:TRINITY_DN61338_c0_g1_i1.p1 TRINITY_DN61338_c0_g1~~TRINITY_DN61338_c0_g1_i1.p1  ORF type:complete len:324 (-),score=46.18 TRINITY_DN61338_c0_g1_i1:407-1279(-)
MAATRPAVATAAAATAVPGGEAGVAAALDRIGGALWGLFIADAMAMPTHWYYGGEGQVARDYGGPLKGYVQPKKNLSGSIMNLSNTGGAGRGSDQGDIIGSVINHGKKEFWTARGSFHYHCTLAKGENTLEAQLTRQVCNSIVETGGTFSPEHMIGRYMTFMQTPGSHNDCYASTCHRMFFANLKKGGRPEECADNDNHNVDTIDGLIMPVPVILAGWRGNLQDVQRGAASCAALTRRSDVLPQFTNSLTAVLLDVIAGVPLQQALATKAGARFDGVIKNAARSADPIVA